MADPEKQKDLYTWRRTEEERNLQETLDHASKFYGEVRSWDTTTLPLEGTNLREIFPDIDDDATHIRMSSYERFDHSIYAEHIESAGLTVSLVQRDRYAEGSQTEPIKLGIGLSNQEGSIFAEFMVASRHWQDDIARQAYYPPTQDENRPPHVRLTTKDTTDINKIFISAKQSVELSSDSPQTEGQQFDYKKKWLECLDRLQELLTTLDDGETDLTPEQMSQVDELANLYFFDDPKSLTKLRDEEDTAYNPQVHYRKIKIPKSPIRARLGKLTLRRKK